MSSGRLKSSAPLTAAASSRRCTIPPTKNAAQWDAAQYGALGIAPSVPYAPGSCTATAQYPIQPRAATILIRLLHWSHTTPYLEFLRDVGGPDGAALWNAWQAALTEGGGRPVVIATHMQLIDSAANGLSLSPRTSIRN